MRSLNEPAEEEVEEEGIQGAEEEGSETGIPEMWSTVPGSLTETASCCTAGLTRIRAGGGGRESPSAAGCSKYLVLCALCQQGLPGGGEERRGGEGGGWPGRAAVRRALHSGWRSPAPGWKQANGLCSAQDSSDAIFHQRGREHQQHACEADTHCVYWSICTNTCAPSAT